MSWAHVGAGRPGLDPGVGGCGNAGKCASLGDQGHGGGGAVSCEAAAASQGCHPHPHTSHPSKGETGAEVAKWSGAGHGDREVRIWICVILFLIWFTFCTHVNRME